MLDSFHIVLAVAAFIKNTDGKILIVKKAPSEKVDGGLWTVPGGKVDPQEPIIEALKRETFEEAGITIGTFNWIGENVFESNGFWFHGQHFVCTFTPPQEVVLEKNLTEHRWVGRDELDQYEFHPNIRSRLLQLFTSQDAHV